MRGWSPALGIGGAAAWMVVASELWCALWLNSFLLGVASVFVVPWAGPGIGGTGWFSFIALPVLLGTVLAVLSVVLAAIRPARIGEFLFATGGIALLGWTALSGLFGLGATLESLQLPVFANGFYEVYPNSVWSRWLFDGAALLAIAIGFGLGPDRPLARRALWTGLCAVAADNGWRIAVAVASGHIPMVYGGLGRSGWVFHTDAGQSTSWMLLFVWAVFGVLAALFMALFANLPHREGPHRFAVLGGLALCGLGLGVQGAMLYSVPFWEALGMIPRLDIATPEYPGMLALLRTVLYGTGAVTLALAQWRLSD